MKTDYGNTFNYKRSNLDAGKIPLWLSVDEQYPSGGYKIADETSYPIGTKIPAGTPVKIDKLGGTITLKEATAPMGLTYEDAYVGTNGCTVTIVTRGQILVDRVETSAGLTSAAQTALASRISFVKEA